MSVKSAFSVTKALSEAAAFLPRAWVSAGVALGVLLIATIVWLHLYMFHIQPLVVHLAILGLAVLKLVAIGGLYRVALFGKTAKVEGLGPGGLQFGVVEVRLLVSGLLAIAFFVLIAATLFIVFAVAFRMSGAADGYATSWAAVQALANSHDSAQAGYLVVVVIAAVWLLIFVGLKFTLMPAANVASRRLITLNALGLTSGYVGKLFQGLVVLLLPLFLAWLALIYGLPRIGDFYIHMALIGLYLAVSVAIVLPMSIGFFASAYRQIVASRAK